ncbi:hypothetical protein FRB99_008760 [Tulasnella sp. 403]|nr:hypothetical protein FRB99_008760 [Tulasnella sp. 403]
MVYCQVQKDLLDSLESFAYTFEDDRDRGIEIRREARKVAQLLGDPNFLDMRCHAEGAHLMREKTLQSRNNSRRSLRRRGALLSFRRGSGSDANTVVTDDSWASEASAPITIRQKVRLAVSEAVNLETAMSDIREIARRTSCPDDFMEIMEAILESLLTDEYDKTWGQVFKALVLLRQCLGNVSEDVAQHFQGNPTVMRLLRGFQDLEPFHLVGESAAVLRSSGLSEKLQLALPGAIPLAPNETAVAREPPIYAILDPRRDSNTSAVAPVISAFDAFEEKRPRGSIVSTNSQNGIVPRPLPIPPIPVDWSRLHTSAGPQIAPLPNILPPEKAFISSAWRARQSLSLNNDVPRPLPPVPQPVTPSRGFSDVFKGTLTHERKDGTTWDEAVAIKVLRAVKLKPGESADDRINKRMHREMNIWSRATHPHIVPLRGYALEGDGTPSLISPWFEHGDVLSYLKKYPFADRRRLVRQVAQGLTYLHAQSPPVIHGDLKGGNVLINSQGDAALCDFGLSKLLQDCPSTFTTSSVGVGTLRWCAPEMWTADEPIKTLATDVWAFGALALEILTGRFPFYKLTNDHKVIFDVTNGVIPAREDYPELPADNKFWDILESCWKQDPDERPSMAQLIELISDDEMFSAVETDA